MSPIVSKVPAVDDRDQTPPTRSRQISFKVGEELLDMMAADDVNRNRTALETLEENKKITCAERYLRKRFRKRMLQFILADIAQCEKIHDDDREKLYRLSQEEAKLAGEISKNQEGTKRSCAMILEGDSGKRALQRRFPETSKGREGSSTGGPIKKINSGDKRSSASFGTITRSSKCPKI